MKIALCLTHWSQVYSIIAYYVKNGKVGAQFNRKNEKVGCDYASTMNHKMITTINVRITHKYFTKLGMGKKSRVVQTSILLSDDE